ncbi:MAG: hypothetical protein COA50_09910 [Flavobacteriaceae bacterium]|nr:MAG: hypothetical protein COA50_09910 [Flavobacteriaceae bacterium]
MKMKNGYSILQMKILSNTIGVKKILLTPLLIVSIFNSCDTSESFDAVITNSTDMDLKLHFASNSVLSELSSNTEILSIKSGTSKNYKRIEAGNGIGLARLTTLKDFDSIYITNTTDDILKVYKEANAGKNIYDIQDYWTVKSVTKNHDEYTYDITDENIR